MPGHGLLQCAIYDHIAAGMSALYTVNATVKLDPPNAAPVRTYYIAAELIDWDYAPAGLDGCSGQPFTEEQEVIHGHGGWKLFAAQKQARVAAACQPLSCQVLHPHSCNADLCEDHQRDAG